ncbi:MAG: hypothetical protein ACR2JW_16080 [Thermomicrobiales bacterium]
MNNQRESRPGRPEGAAKSRFLYWLAPLCVLACAAVSCATTVATPTAHAGVPTIIASPDISSPPALSGSTTTIIPTVSVPVSGLVVTVLATDVALWRAPDTLSGNVTVSFMFNGNPIETSVYVSGELPVLETNIVGVDGTTRWTRVLYSGHVGPLESGTSFVVMGYLRNDLISAPHAPMARNP